MKAEGGVDLRLPAASGPAPIDRRLTPIGTTERIVPPSLGILVPLPGATAVPSPIRAASGRPQTTTLHQLPPDIGNVRGKLDPSDFGNILFKAAEGLSQYKSSHKLDECVRPGPLRKGPIPSEAQGSIHEKLEDCNCQFFFRQVGLQLLQRGFDLEGEEWTNTSLQADDIASAIATSPNWKKVTADEAQEYANRGVLVEGVLIAKPHGHLATVSPVLSGFDVSKLDGSGPLVQDGNEHFVPAARANGIKQNFPSTWGVIRASKAMPSATSQWYVWLPSER